MLNQEIAPEELRKIRALETLTQSCKEHTESTVLARELASAKARLIIVEQELAEASGLIRSLRQEAAA